MRRMALAAACLFTLCGCGGSGFSGPSHFTDPVFTATPLAMSSIVRVWPLGALSGGAHEIPTKHSGMDMVDILHCPCDFSTPRDVFAPAGGTVNAIIRSGDDAIYVDVAEDFQYYIGHIVVTPGVDKGSRLSAGQKIGTTSGMAAGVDFGVVNLQVTNMFAAPERYPQIFRSADHPVSHFAEPLRSQLIAKITPAPALVYGRVSWDRAGTLEGNWYLEGTPDNETANQPDYWPNLLCFVYDPWFQDEVRIGFGTALTVNPVLVPNGGPVGISSGPAPETVTPASGLVVYQLASEVELVHTTSLAVGTLLVQMTDATHVTVEGFADQGEHTAFTANARHYVR